MAKSKRESMSGTKNGFVEIRNFKSIKYVKLKPSRVNIFIGRPNSGKSNLIESLTLFNLVKPKNNRVFDPTILRYTSLDDLFYDRETSNDIQISFSGNKAILTYYRSVNLFIQLINPSPEFMAEKDKLFSQRLSINNIQEKISFLAKEQKGKYESKYAVLNFDGEATGGSG
jgi:AAA15 family ATPase/GTPase